MVCAGRLRDKRLYWRRCSLLSPCALSITRISNSPTYELSWEHSAQRYSSRVWLVLRVSFFALRHLVIVRTFFFFFASGIRCWCRNEQPSAPEGLNTQKQQPFHQVTYSTNLVLPRVFLYTTTAMCVRLHSIIRSEARWMLAVECSQLRARRSRAHREQVHSSHHESRRSA
jgi:hypothetical protein